MAKTHTPNGAYTNPEVRFETSDVNSGQIVSFGIGFALLVVGSLGCSWLLFWVVERAENKSKVSPLPPAAVDSNPLPPHPRLEALEDVREHNIALWPPRAANYLAPQQEILTKGDRQADILPIQDAIDKLAGKLPARKNAPPKDFAPDLPSQSSSGRTVKGGR
jgi:hypothetical protein